MAGKTKKQIILDEIGEIGIKTSFGGTFGGVKLDIEPLDLLKGPHKFKWYKEMVLNDPFIGANYKMTTILGAKGEWAVKPGTESKKDLKAAEFINECLFQDLEHDFSEYVKFTLGSLFVYGFSLSEKVFKKRSDGRYVLKKLAKRLASTIEEWKINKHDNIEFIVQEEPNNLNKYKIPYTKLVHCKLDDVDGSHEGVPLIRGCFTAYYTKKFVEAQERIRVSKDASGNLIFKVPMALLSSKDPKHVNFLEGVKKGLVNIANAKDSCMIVPSEQQYDLQMLERKGGSLTQDTNTIIERCDRYIATNLLADFLLLGLKTGGTGNLIQPKIRIYSSFVSSLMDIIKYQVNKNIIPQLLEINNIKYDKLPYIQHENLSELLNIEAALLIQSAGQWINSIGNAEQYNYLMRKFLGSGFPILTEKNFEELKSKFDKDKSLNETNLNETNNSKEDI